MRAILRGCGCLLLAWAVILNSPDAGRAHDEPAKAGEHKDGEHKEHHADPEKDLLAIRADLGIATLVVFGLLLLVLWLTAWGPMLEGLKKRETFLVDQRNAAATDRAEAERLLAEVKSQLAKSHDQARAILDEARKDGEALRVRIETEAKAAVQGERERMLREIETARDQALADLYNRSVELASLVSAKAVGRSLGDGDHRRLLDEALAELDTAGKAGAFAGSDGGLA